MTSEYITKLKREYRHRDSCVCGDCMAVYHHNKTIDDLNSRNLIVQEGMVNAVCRGGDVIDQRLITLEVPMDFRIVIGDQYMIATQKKED